MDYKAFALKYRPQNFDEVVGQEQTVLSLRNAIIKKHVHHAYLFSGPRGTGKTSLARIFAKSLNCQSANGPVIKPCGKCVSCAEIIKGTSLDIIEIDGASNRQIDDIRSLRENVKLSPAHSRYKIYIIDEVHMLTSEAFNALLKTLEEPPPHVKFIFATTHPHKVLPTILSRCQKFPFSLVPLEKIVDKLKRIVTSEGLKIEDSLLYAIGRAAGGSIRDAESLLDQLVPVLAQNGSIEEVFSFLGIIDEETLNRALQYIIEKDLDSSLAFIDKIAKEGKDLGIFLNALIEYVRNLLLSQVSAKSFKELIDISPQAKDFISKYSSGISTTEVLRIIDSLIEAKDLSHKLNTVRIPLELALVKCSYHEENQKILPQKKDDPAVDTKPAVSDAVVAAKIVEDEFDLDVEPTDIHKDKMLDGDIEEDRPAGEDNVLFEELKSKWQGIIVHIQKMRAAIASHLSLAEPLSSSGAVVTIGFSRKDYFHKEIVESAKNAKFIEGVISNILGKSVGVKFTLSDSVKPSAQHRVRDEEAANEEIASQADEGGNEFMNELLDTFKGQLHTESE
ncbi:MAG: DNA polymerase III subunit gamma/tau [Candidatus Omnitrophota bacterium]